MAQSWIFISPHLDDAVYSCGAWIVERTSQGDSVEIWTVVTGDPPPGPLTDFAETLHDRWGVTRTDAFAVRREEDVAACRAVGATHRHFDLPDAIYRRHPQSGAAFYPEPEDIFKQPAAYEMESLPAAIAGWMRPHLGEGDQVLLPLGVGGHVDHQIVRAAGERLGAVSGYFADLPYILWDDTGVPALVPAGYRLQVFPVVEAALAGWLAGIQAYASQFSSFWPSPEQLEAEIRGYLEPKGGLRLWRSVS